MLTQEQIESARSVGLLDYLQIHEPGNLRKISARSYCLNDHDSLKISNGKWFWFSQGFGSNNALDFLVKVRGLSFVDAVENLTGTAFHGVAPMMKPEPKPGAQPEKNDFLLPPRNTDHRRVTAYLLSRGINRDIIDRCIADGSLFESAGTHNCVFVGRDSAGKVRYAAMRGTIGNFKQEVANSDKRLGFYLPADTPGCPRLAVFESAIDALSMATLQRASLESPDVHYLALGGTSPLALEQFLSDHPAIRSVTLCLDNDVTGRDAAQRLLTALQEQGIQARYLPPEKHKDWNEALLSIHSQHRHQEHKAAQSR
jgi:hypothetical protein